MGSTRPAPTSEPENTGSEVAYGTIGFELYLAALQLPFAATLKPPPIPKEAVK
jgi:hypothetical protein